jgi:hypothetical protein
MDVVMAQQSLTPSMQDGEESNLCAGPLWIGSDFEQGLGTGVECKSRSGLGEVSASGFSSWETVKTTWK